MTAGGTSIPEVQALLRVLAAGRRAAEIGTAYGEGAAAIAETAATLVTVELDPERAVVARERLAGYDNVEFVEGNWHEVLPARAPFEFLFWDGGGWKHDPYSHGPEVLTLLAPTGIVLSDDFTPGRSVESDPARAFLLRNDALVATEVAVSPEMAVIVAAKVS